MRIKLKEISVRDIVNGYQNNEEEGVVGYGGQLNIRPKYQREFIYKDKQQQAVINTIRHNFPLNVMYWVKNADGSFELLDGQQRTLSFCEYINGGFSVNYQYYHNLDEDEQKEILDYKVMVYLCDGSDKEKLDWFTTINIAGEKLTNQELRNAVYAGEWLTDAKKYFSKRECPAYNIAKSYLKGSAIRQDFLETALSWISKGNVEEYMASKQHTSSASDLWLYFQNVIIWVKTAFPNYRKEMKGVGYGPLYDEFKDKSLDPAAIEKEIVALMKDEDVTKKAGIYPFILTRETKHLSIRTFSDNQKRESFEKQNGICPKCGETFEIEGMEADHITPWCEGGKTTADNCQMLCKKCNRLKSNK